MIERAYEQLEAVRLAPSAPIDPPYARGAECCMDWDHLADGLCAELGIIPDLRSATCSKALASQGGIIAGDRKPGWYLFPRDGLIEHMGQDLEEVMAWLIKNGVFGKKPKLRFKPIDPT